MTSRDVHFVVDAFPFKENIGDHVVVTDPVLPLVNPNASSKAAVHGETSSEEEENGEVENVPDVVQPAGVSQEIVPIQPALRRSTRVVQPPV